MGQRHRVVTIAIALTVMLVGLAGASAGASTPQPAVQHAVAAPLEDPFYDYTGPTPLAEIEPGTVLKQRTVPYHLLGLPLPLRAIQLLYRTRDALGDPAVNATTVIRPLGQRRASRGVVSYQSFYDSLDPADQPSAVIAGGAGLSQGIVNAETLLIAPLLLAGYTVNIPDTEGQHADFAAGPEYGTVTLDSLRAISRAGTTGVDRQTPIGLIGYSGGAIASEWAAELAATHAPRIADRIVGTAIGGVLVHPARNLRYISGTPVWSGVLPMGLIGLARAYEVDLRRYASDYGRRLSQRLQDASITDALGRYPGLTWDDLVKPQYDDLTDVPELVEIANQLIMSTGGTPSAPMFVGQGTAGDLEGTPGNKPGIGKGDGVTIAGDVRALARRYCERGVTVQYRQYANTHIGSAVQWLPQAYGWLTDRFRGEAAPSSCGAIPEGNPQALTPLTATGE